jgi:hypothetical protein
MFSSGGPATEGLAWIIESIDSKGARANTQLIEGRVR